MELIHACLTIYPESVRYLSRSYFIGNTGNLYLNDVFVRKIRDHEYVIGISKNGKPLRAVRGGEFSYVSRGEVHRCKTTFKDRFIVGIYKGSIITSQEDEFDDMSVETLNYFHESRYITHEIYKCEEERFTSSNKFAVFRDKCYMIREYADKVFTLEEATEVPGENIIVSRCESVYVSKNCLYAINGNEVKRLV